MMTTASGRWILSCALLATISFKVALGDGLAGGDQPECTEPCLDDPNFPFCTCLGDAFGPISDADFIAPEDQVPCSEPCLEDPTFPFCICEGAALAGLPPGEAFAPLGDQPVCTEPCLDDPNFPFCDCQGEAVALPPGLGELEDAGEQPECTEPCLDDPNFPFCTCTGEAIALPPGVGEDVPECTVPCAEDPNFPFCNCADFVAGLPPASGDFVDNSITLTTDEDGNVICTGGGCTGLLTGDLEETETGDAAGPVADGTDVPPGVAPEMDVTTDATDDTGAVAPLGVTDPMEEIDGTAMEDGMPEMDVDVGSPLDAGAPGVAPSETTRGGDFGGALAEDGAPAGVEEETDAALGGRTVAAGALGGLVVACLAVLG